MSGIKTLLGDGATGVDDFDLGEDFGRYAMGQELLPLLKAARDQVAELRDRCHSELYPTSLERGTASNVAVLLMRRTKASETLEDLDALIASIERSPEVSKGATPEEIAQSIADMPF